MTLSVTNKTKKLESVEAELDDYKTMNHEQSLKIKELETEKQLLTNHVEKLNTELNNTTTSMQGKKDYSDEELRNLLDEHKSEKDEWEKIRESRLIRSILQNY